MKKSNVKIMNNETLNSEYMITNFGEDAYKVATHINDLKVSFCEINTFTNDVDKSLLHNDIVEYVGNVSFIDFKLLEDDNLLIESDYKGMDLVNNDDRERVLKLAHKRSKSILDLKLHEFMLEHINWLDDYSLYMSVKENLSFKTFDDWKGYKQNHKENIDKIRNDFEEDINYHIFVQYEFHKQWRNLKKYFDDMGIKAKRVLEVK
ncbi:MAG: 4-alpha-glucanotransferase [Sarcina sp.]